MSWKLRGRRSFQALQRSGRRSRTTSLWCTYLDDPSARPLRVAYAIGRAAGPATRRNLLRRRLRALLEPACRHAGLERGMVLIGAGQPATELKFDALGRELSELLHRVVRREANPR